MTSTDLVSPLPRSECVRRLRERVRPGNSVAGHVDESKFRLHKIIGYRNSFQTHVKGCLEDDPGGTRIHCRFGLHPFVRAFMIFWLTGASFAGLMMLVSGNGNAGIALFPIAGAGILLIGRALAGNEEEFLTNYLRNLLEAPAL
jgi:hypothetical protein